MGLINAELDAMRARDDIDPMQVLMGPLLALLALRQTMPMAHAPPNLTALYVAVQNVVNDLIVERLP